jgi:hypothetical protein
MTGQRDGKQPRSHRSERSIDVVGLLKMVEIPGRIEHEVLSLQHGACRYRGCCASGAVSAPQLWAEGRAPAAVLGDQDNRQAFRRPRALDLVWSR